MILPDPKKVSNSNVKRRLSSKCNLSNWYQKCLSVSLKECGSDVFLFWIIFIFCIDKKMNFYISFAKLNTHDYYIQHCYFDYFLSNPSTDNNNSDHIKQKTLWLELN